MKKLRKRHSGEGYIDVCVLVVCAMLVLALAVRILPVFVAKQQLDTYAVELVREAEISGRVGTETSRRAAALTDSTVSNGSSSMLARFEYPMPKSSR